jgi:hypothetical protein
MKKILLWLSLGLALACGLAQAQIPPLLSQPQAVYGNTAVATYSASANMSNTATGDIYCISGSATRAVHIKGVRISALGTGTQTLVKLNKYSSAPTGGTPTTAPTLVPNDSQNAPATATVTAYTTAPTSGTLVGTFRSQYIAVVATSGATTSQPALFQFSVYWDQPIVLHGTGENMCVNVGVGAATSWAIDHEHVEF